MDINIELNDIFDICSGILLLTLIFLQVKGKLEDRRFKKWNKRITKRGWRVIIIYIILLAIGIFSRKIQSENEKEQQSQRDSIIADGIEKGIDAKIKKANDSLINRLSDSLQRYGLKIDTLKGSITENKKKEPYSITVTQIEPFLEIGSIYEANDPSGGKYYRINVVSKNAPSKNFNITLKAWLEYKNGDTKGIYFDLLPSESRLDKNTTVLRPLRYTNTENLKIIYIYIQGSYTNLLGNNKFYIDEMMYKDLTGKMKGNMLVGQQKQKMVNFFENQKFNKIDEF